MFCYQCEQTGRGSGCTKQGVCGKDDETARLQDLLFHVTKGISMYAHRARGMGVVNNEIDVFVAEALFTTVTNVNFDPQRIEGLIREGLKIRSRAAELFENASKKKGNYPEKLYGPAVWEPKKDYNDLLKQAEEIGIESRREDRGEDLVGLEEVLTYGLKGAAAYADHAYKLGQLDDSVFAFFHQSLDFLTRENTIDELLGMCLKVGEINLKVMGLLDKANTDSYGHPEPTQVRTTPLAGKAILVSGHDLKDLEELLKQTEGKGINVYTHGEMLPALAYPKLKKYKHLVGNYGSAWQNQRKEFEAFPGAILMTTNCIQKPKEAYQARIFTSGLVAWPKITHIEDYDFSPVIESALSAPGFDQDHKEETIIVGFGRNAVMNVADKVIEAVKSGAIKHFFLVGGCDGAKPGRSYYTDFAQAVPKDCVILTLACGKYRFNNLDFGDIGGIPRLLDIGQCNDAYSAIQIAVALAKAFDTDVNGLPLSMVLSWYEQKAVAILLTLFHLGVENIRLGPSLPAFITPAALDVLVSKFKIAPISDVDSDLKFFLEGDSHVS
jgi:hydroxylamine reductase